ncbi:hypothetical protein HY251_20030 [bacterium]|nr:hypothetical protein [bacterium]
MARSPQDRLMKKIGIAQKLFTRTQWGKASKRIDAAGRGSVGDELVSMGVVTPEQLRGLDRAIAYRMGRDDDKELAKVITDSGYATDAAVEDAFRRQKEIYGQTGELVRVCSLLVDGGVLTQQQHLAAQKILTIARAAKKEGGTRDDEESDQIS